MFLAGDIGGTKTNLAVYAYEHDQLINQGSASYANKDHASIEEIIRDFLAGKYPEVKSACFGIAGPVKDGQVHVTNLPWIVDASALRSRLNFKQVSLLNDLEANAYGIQTLRSDELIPINPDGNPRQIGNRALISAGTGLGEAGLLWDGVAYRPFATEGGHASFAPNDATGDELLCFLRREHGHVSWERVLSGMGMKNLYRFFRHRSGQAEPAWLSEEIAAGDLAAVVSKAGLEGKDPVCVESVDYFTRNYGAETANLALKMLALGGVYIGGGIAPKMLTKLKSEIFRDAFYNKGRMSPLLKSTPVYVILNDKTALQGAAWFAAHAD
ncbi:MAG TPA: glucokinase [Candidatus Methylacidiphilales bacterium]|nr:glucokinase [Candidatus Methylacidiphilales bacterium]